MVRLETGIGLMAHRLLIGSPPGFRSSWSLLLKQHLALKTWVVVTTTKVFSVESTAATVVFPLYTATSCAKENWQFPTCYS